VNSTLQDKTDEYGALSTSALAAAVAAGLPERAVRQRYVIGVFREPSFAYGAVEGLPPERCEMLMVLDAALGPEANAAVFSDGSMTIDTLESPGTVTLKLTSALRKLGTFAALSAQSSTDADGVQSSSGAARLIGKVVQHLSIGAAVVIISTPGTEQQLRVSRLLLDAKCDTLLTHDVLETGCGSALEPAPQDDSCRSCTTRSCGRIGAP
jgi:hypothetical protein